MPSPTPFAAHFGLKDPTKSSFTLSPQHDAALYVELKDEKATLARLLSNAERTRALVDGDFGSGKTHLLRSVVEETWQGQVLIWRELSVAGPRVQFFGEGGVAQQMMTEVLRVFAPLLRPLDTAEVDQALTEGKLDFPDVRRALLAYFGPTSMGGGESPVQGTARTWLTGSKITAVRLDDAGYKQRLHEVLNPGDTARLFDILAGLALRKTGRRSLLVVDETNTFSNHSSPELQNQYGDWIRTLLDPDRRFLGVLWGAVVPRARGATHPALRRDLRSRIPTVIQLPPLGDLGAATQFLEGLWRKLSQPRGMRPFRMGPDAIRWTHDNIARLRMQYPVYPPVSLSVDPARRDLLHVLTLIGENAVSEGTEEIEVRHLQVWFPEEA